MIKGHIWPEYWIDCGRCSFHEPLAVKSRPRAESEALRRGWAKLPHINSTTYQIKGVWYCTDCKIIVQREHAEKRLGMAGIIVGVLG